MEYDANLRKKTAADVCLRGFFEKNHVELRRHREALFTIFAIIELMIMKAKQLFLMAMAILVFLPFPVRAEKRTWKAVKIENFSTYETGDAIQVPITTGVNRTFYRATVARGIYVCPEIASVYVAPGASEFSISTTSDFPAGATLNIIIGGTFHCQSRIVHIRKQCEDLVFKREHGSFCNEKGADVPELTTYSKGDANKFSVSIGLGGSSDWSLKEAIRKAANRVEVAN